MRYSITKLTTTNTTTTGGRGANADDDADDDDDNNVSSSGSNFIIRTRSVWTSPVKTTAHQKMTGLMESFNNIINEE